MVAEITLREGVPTIEFHGGLQAARSSVEEIATKGSRKHEKGTELFTEDRRDCPKRDGSAVRSIAYFSNSVGMIMSATAVFGINRSPVKTRRDEENHDEAKLHS